MGIVCLFLPADEINLFSEISGHSQLFTWSSFRQVIEECPNPLSKDRLHFEYPEMSVGVNVRFLLQITVEAASYLITLGQIKSDNINRLMTLPAF